MTDTKLLEAWCHWAETNNSDDEFASEGRLMAAEIRRVLAELEAAREVIACLDTADYSALARAISAYGGVAK